MAVSESRGRLDDLEPSVSRSSSQSSGWFDALTGEVIDQLHDFEEREELPVAEDTEAAEAESVANAVAAAAAIAVTPVAVSPWTLQKMDLRYPPPPPPNPPVFTDKMDNANVSMEHRNGTCDPCVFFSSTRGCAKGSACRFCHLGNHVTSEKAKAIQRPRKQTRDKYKSVVQKLLQRMELSPAQADQAHEELQAEARKSPYVCKLLQGYLDGHENLDFEPLPQFGMMAYPSMPVPSPLPPVPMHQPLVYPVQPYLGPTAALHMGPRALYSR